MKRPNIVYILADDLGYGDVGCNNPWSKIPTPNVDRLAERGMRFTDAHAGSAVCTPSRYNLLTGRYAWRSRLKRGIVWEWDGSLIEPDRLTVAGLLQRHGYRTACIGKWHLGWDWPTFDGEHPNDTLPYGVRGEYHDRPEYAARIDFTKRLAGGPVDHGFDSYFGVDVPNFAPYAWFTDDRLAGQPTTHRPPNQYCRPGPAIPGWTWRAMIPEFTEQAVEIIESHADSGTERPYFLYLPLTSPHSPIVPNDKFLGTSGIGAYGDFVCEVDWVVGRVMDALDHSGAADNTLVIFASDNGPEDQRPDDEGVYARARRSGHYSMSSLRGIKCDTWEGGHRVPMLAAWPDVIPRSSRCDQTVCLGDFMATCADILRIPPPDGAGEDSVSMLHLFRGAVDRPSRKCTIHHSSSGTFAIRRGNWVFIDAPGGGDRPEPDDFRRERGYQSHDLPGELFDLRDDLGQRRNRYAERADIVDSLKTLLEAVKVDPAAQRVS